ncbi:DNA-binding IscR family transcriptional regulator [Paenibacillus phyllosphaerae]|uniref:DNA-binding IscR family transcriptional regulator n=1 Tax=Paenibacillus phyllosphaerae TaxID=274593 RepID=A0A7W5B102_9BACL|nr:Rrf2 family transcriptional regulator [Paenibacillus phyllosphaerae]MBB3112417.1 DNA-binding IscR family transcriptional regulator [Paenibacillus phyllosphaerae]
MISSRFTVAVHILALVHINNGNVTSDYIAASVNTNPAVIRRIMSMLSKSGLIASHPGVIGINLQKPISAITLLDVYRAVELPETKELFTVHQNTNVQCMVGKEIQQALETPLTEAQRQMEQALAHTSIESVVADILHRHNNEAGSPS